MEKKILEPESGLDRIHYLILVVNQQVTSVRDRETLHQLKFKLKVNTNLEEIRNCIFLLHSFFDLAHISFPGISYPFSDLKSFLQSTITTKNKGQKRSSSTNLFVEEPQDDPQELIGNGSGRGAGAEHGEPHELIGGRGNGNGSGSGRGSGSGVGAEHGEPQELIGGRGNGNGSGSGRGSGAGAKHGEPQVLIGSGNGRGAGAEH
ncbi:hypothetical protein BpHYR1_015979, partial [Brachionus plicatilis]